METTVKNSAVSSTDLNTVRYLEVLNGMKRRSLIKRMERWDGSRQWGLDTVVPVEMAREMGLRTVPEDVEITEGEAAFVYVEPGTGRIIKLLKPAPRGRKPGYSAKDKEPEPQPEPQPEPERKRNPNEQQRPQPGAGDPAPFQPTMPDAGRQRVEEEEALPGWVQALAGVAGLEQDTIGAAILGNVWLKLSGAVGLIMVQSWIFAALYAEYLPHRALPFGLTWVAGFIIDFGALMLAFNIHPKVGQYLSDGVSDGRQVWVWVFFIYQCIQDFAFVGLLGGYSEIVGQVIVGVSLPLGIAVYSTLFFQNQKTK